MALLPVYLDTDTGNLLAGAAPCDENRQIVSFTLSSMSVSNRWLDFAGQPSNIAGYFPVTSMQLDKITITSSNNSSAPFFVQKRGVFVKNIAGEILQNLAGDPLQSGEPFQDMYQVDTINQNFKVVESIGLDFAPGDEVMVFVGANPGVSNPTVVLEFIDVC